LRRWVTGREVTGELVGVAAADEGGGRRMVVVGRS
jgi:hypothetical protein